MLQKQSLGLPEQNRVVNFNRQTNLEPKLNWRYKFKKINESIYQWLIHCLKCYLKVAGTVEKTKTKVNPYIWIILHVSKHRSLPCPCCSDKQWMIFRCFLKRSMRFWNSIICWPRSLPAVNMSLTDAGSSAMNNVSTWNFFNSSHWE